jgi:hypothetical protein
MTHDELLALIDSPAWSALCAVVVSHNPEHPVRGFRCVKCDELYPCAEAEALEDQIK